MPDSRARRLSDGRLDGYGSASQQPSAFDDPESEIVPIIVEDIDEILNTPDTVTQTRRNGSGKIIDSAIYTKTRIVRVPR